MKNAQESLDLLMVALRLQGVDVRFHYDDDDVAIYCYNDLKQRVLKQHVDVAHLTGLHMMQKVLENVNWILLDEGYEA